MRQCSTLSTFVGILTLVEDVVQEEQVPKLTSVERFITMIQRRGLPESRTGGDYSQLLRHRMPDIKPTSDTVTQLELQVLDSLLQAVYPR